MQSKFQVLLLTVVASLGLGSQAQAATSGPCALTSFSGVSGFGHGAITNVFVPPGGGGGAFSFTFNSPTCAWTVTHTGQIASIQTPTQGAGSGSVSFSAASYSTSGTGARFDNFSINLVGESVQSVQGFTLNQNSPNCAAPVPSPASQHVPAAGGSFSFAMPIMGECWIDGYSASSGVSLIDTSNAVVSYSIGANSGTARSLSISVQYPSPGVTFQINQDGTVVAPSITSLSPSTAVAGGALFGLTVTGANLGGGTINFNGTPLSTTTNTASIISATVTPSLIPTAGSFAVTVTTPGGTSNTLPFTVTAPVNTLNVSPGSFSFNGTVGGPKQTAPLSISWTGLASGAYNLEATPVSGWLSTSSAQIIVSGNSTSVTVTADPTNLTPTTYQGSIKLTPLTAGNPTTTIPVTFNVTGPVTLTANPASLTFTAENGAAPAAKNISLAGFSGAATLKTSTTSGGSWLVVTGQATVPGTFSVNVNTTGVQAGRYDGSITVTPSQAGVLPLTIGVALEVGNTPSLTIAPSPLTFHYRIGDPLPPQQSLSVFTTGSSLTVPASVLIAPQSWLSGTSTSGNTPLTLPFTINPAGLGAGTYTTPVAVTSSQANPSSVIAQLTLIVDPAPASQLQVSQSTIVFHTTAGATASQGQLILTNAGGTTNYTAELKECGCLAITGGATGTVTPSSPGIISYTMSPPTDPAGGSYFARLVIHSAGNPDIVIPASILATATSTPQLIVLGQTGIEFVAIEGSTTPISQNVAILNGGSGTLNAILTPSTVSGNNWLSATGQVSVTTATTSVAAIQVNPSSLLAGRYTGRVDVSSTTAGNSPQSVAVALNVIAKGSNIPPEATPAGFIFLSSGEQPADQNVTLTNRNTFSTIFNSTVAADANGSWLSMTPSAGTVAAGGTSTTAIHVNPQGLNPGAYQGTITIVFSDGTQRIVQVATHIFAPTAGDTPAVSVAGRLAPRATCTISTLQAVIEAPGDQFPAVIGRAVPLQASMVAKNCGDPLKIPGVTLDAMEIVTTDSSNAIKLTPTTDSNGRAIFTGTWTPTASGPAALQLNASVFPPNSRNALGADLDRNNIIHHGTVSSLGDPVLRTAANSASQNPASQASPGLSVTLKGDSLSAMAPISALSDPSLKTTLGDVQVLVGGTPRPIQYTSAGQINFLVPFDNVNQNVGMQVQVMRGNLASQMFTLEVTNVTPAIYTMSSDGLGQAAVLVANAVEGGHAVLAATQPYGGLTSRPVKRGETIAIYCTGLGGVSSPPAAGQPASGTVLSPSTLMPVVIFGNATVGTKMVAKGSTNYFSGLAPGFIGLYQVNVQVPMDAPTGTVDLQLLFDTNGAVSNVVQIAVQ